MISRMSCRIYRNNSTTLKRKLCRLQSREDWVQLCPVDDLVHTARRDFIGAGTVSGGFVAEFATSLSLPFWDNFKAAHGSVLNPKKTRSMTGRLWLLPSGVLVLGPVSKSSESVGAF
jgi:hypothetical protein